MRDKNYLEYLNQESKLFYEYNDLFTNVPFLFAHAKQIFAAEKLQSQFKTYGIR